MDIIAEKFSVECFDLIVLSLEWHWLKLASNSWLPVQDETGFVSMLKKVKLKPEPYVIIHMQALVKRKAAELVGNAWDITDEVESDFEDRPVSKKVHNQFISVYLVLNLFKVKLDDALELIVKRLSDKYSPGLCSLHPNLSCFHHCASNLHFNLDHP